jgi:branched-chain amino acid transport system ATP-binding protein
MPSYWLIPPCHLVEQHVDVVLEFATQVLVLEGGMLAFLGTPAALRENGDILDRAIGLKKS